MAVAVDIFRAFARRTKATPRDRLAVVGTPDLFQRADAARCAAVHICCVYTYDLSECDRLAAIYRPLNPNVLIGGPGTGMRGEEHVPGLYTALGYLFTSRGCPNHCWFCLVPGREGGIREYPIRDGWNICDDNLLACSEAHVRAVFAMLARQPRHAQFTGGLEAARMQPWHIDLLCDLRAANRFESLYLAYDTPDDWHHLVRVVGWLEEAGFINLHRRIGCHVLCGWTNGDGRPPADTMTKAEARMRAVAGLGLLPRAMVYRGPDEPARAEDDPWRVFARLWQRPTIIASQLKVATPTPEVTP
ncbi:MAG: hypothetical protein WC789_10405 [Lentisphaeria bacterium]